MLGLASRQGYQLICNKSQGVLCHPRALLRIQDSRLLLGFCVFVVVVLCVCVYVCVCFVVVVVVFVCFLGGVAVCLFVCCFVLFFAFLLLGFVVVVVLFSI